MRKHNAEVTASNLIEGWINGNISAVVDELFSYDKKFALFVVAKMVSDFQSPDREAFIHILANRL